VGNSTTESFSVQRQQLATTGEPGQDESVCVKQSMQMYVKQKI